MLREKILSCLGEFPKKVPLDLSIVETVEKDSYVQKRIAYNLESKERTESYLLLPKNLKEKNPAVLAIHQHGGKWELGKSEPAGLAGNTMFAYGVDLVLEGFVVLVPDLIGFEERIPAAFNKDSGTRYTYEKLLALKYLHAGSSLQAKYLFDLTVALDVLENLDYVDIQNIGTLGHSLGGQEATWLTWLDSRIKIGISSCGVGCISAIFKHKILHNYALYLPGFGKVADMDNIIEEIVANPERSFIMFSGLKDEAHFPLDSIAPIEERNKKYPNFLSIKFNAGHSFGDSEKKIAYRALKEKLG